MKKLIKAENSLSFLITITLFSILFLSYSHWQSQQQKRSSLLFQQQQAIQLAENQIALKRSNMPCEQQIEQNGVTFLIHCRKAQINIRFPLGEITIGKP